MTPNLNIRHANAAHYYNQLVTKHGCYSSTDKLKILILILILINIRKHLLLCFISDIIVIIMDCLISSITGPSRNSVYIDASTADILPRDPSNEPSRDIPLDQDGDYSRRADDEGFTFEDDDLHRPYDNI